MKAFFVHDRESEKDLMVVPETDSLVKVDRNVMEEFIGVAPDFTKYTGDRLNGQSPEEFGSIVATRKPDMDVCIIEEAVWQRRMAFYLDAPG